MCIYKVRNAQTLMGILKSKETKNPCNSLMRTFVLKSESNKGLLLIRLTEKKSNVKNAILQNVVSVSVNRFFVDCNNTFYIINGFYLTNNDVFMNFMCVIIFRWRLLFRKINDHP